MFFYVIARFLYIFLGTCERHLSEILSDFRLDGIFLDCYRNGNQ
jgi:hypothetical protein